MGIEFFAGLCLGALVGVIGAAILVYCIIKDIDTENK